MESFKLPLTKEEFRHALRRGHGRALMHVKEFGFGEFRNEFVHACLTNQVHDPQCECSRSDWLLQFFDGVPEWIAKPVYRALLEESDLRSLHQLVELTLGLAKRGDDNAKAALYDGLRPTEWGFLGDDEILELDGQEGFHRIVARVCEEGWFLHWPCCSLLQSYDHLAGDGEAERLLQSHPDPSAVRILQTAAEPHGHFPPDPKKRQNSVENILDWVHDDSVEGHFINRKWVKQASEQELEEILEELKVTTKTCRLRKLMDCLRMRPPERFWPGLLKFTDHEDPEIRRRSYWMLAHYNHDEVHALALSRLREHRFVEGEFKLFQSTFQEPDVKPLLKALRRLPTEDVDVYHWALGDILEIAKHNNRHAIRPLLLYVYEKTPCVNCRTDAVKLLVQIGELPEWIAQECLYDCDPWMQDFAGNSFVEGES